MIFIGNHMKPSTIKDQLHECFQNFPKYKCKILNSTRTHAITCLSLEGKIYKKENHARSLFLSGKPV